jgi:hypothetical protein
MIGIKGEKMDLLERLEQLNQQEKKIKTDQRYSKEYRERLLKQNRQERDRFKAEAFEEMGEAWVNIALDLDELERKEKQAQDAEARSWDYERLNYEAKAARSFAAVSDDITEIVKAYDQAIEGGDREKARAWAEIAPAAIKEAPIPPTFKKEINQTIRRMKKDLAALRQTDELKAVQVEGAELVTKAMELQETSQLLDSRLNSNFIGYDQTRFSNLAESAGLKITQEYDAENVVFVHRLERISTEN